MRPQITIDSTAWRKAASDLQATSSRSVVDFLNGQMLRLLSWTIYDTAKANKSKIQALLTTSTADGKTVAHKMVAKYFREHGVWPVRGSTMDERSARLVALKVQSIAMIRAGWLAAMNLYRRIVRGQPPGVRDIKRFGIDSRKLGGWAKPAKFKIGLITAEAANEAMGYSPREKAWTGKPNPQTGMSVAEAGLRKAMARQTADMISTLAKRLKRDLAKFGAK